MAESPNSPDEQLAQRYHDMSDAELTQLSADIADLTDTARQLLEREMIRRGLALEAPKKPYTPEELAESVPPVLVGRFQYLHDALLAKGQLDAAGIPSSLVDDNMVRMDWFYSNLIGGVKLFVKAEDEAEATEVLNQPIPDTFEVEGVGEFEQPRCPKCNSVDISFESLDKLPSYGSMWLGVPIPVGANRWRCHACDAVCEGDASPDTGST